MNVFLREKLSNSDVCNVASELLYNTLSNKDDSKRVYLCIGTPYLVGDSVGPLVGTLLKQYLNSTSVRVIGTIENPVDNSNLKEVLKDLDNDTTIICIDASTGSGRAGDIGIVDQGIVPRLALDTSNDIIGDTSILCYTNLRGRTDSIKKFIESQVVFVAYVIIKTEEALNKKEKSVV